MSDLPDRIDDVQTLEELLSRPSDALISDMAALSGDIMVLGAGGKIGPSLTRMAARAVANADVDRRVIAVGRRPMPQLAQYGVETVSCDLMDLDAVRALPNAEYIVYMAGRKFGSSGSEWLTWAANCILPYHVASTFTQSRIAVFSTGCVYPLAHVRSGGSTESDPADPIGEYAMSCLGRERVFDYYAQEHGERVVHIRLNYAVETRYGVLADVATKVYREEPIDLTTGYANVMWQGDVCDQVLRALPLAATPPRILNVTGPETISIRWLAKRFGELMGKTPVLVGEENGLGYLSNASQANGLFGNPRVPLARVIEWTADWVTHGREDLNKPTHFEAQNGRY